MKTSTITVKVKPEIKKKAKQVAENLGFNLSTLINAYLADLIRNRTVHFADKPRVRNEQGEQSTYKSDNKIINTDTE